MCFDSREQDFGIVTADREAGHAQRYRVAEEDFGKRLADNGPDAPALNRLGRVFARRAAPEIPVDDENARSSIGRVRECVRLSTFGELLSVVFERVGLEPFEADALEK